MSTLNDQILPIGQKVYCSLYGGKTGLIVSQTGEQSPETSRSLGGIGVSGGRAQFSIVWEDGSQSSVPESLVRRSVQWKILDYVASKPEVEGYQRKAEQYINDVQRRQEDEKRAFEQAVDRIKAENPTLTVVSPSDRASKVAAQNIRQELKKAFPGVKFSVKSDYSSIDVSWEDGPREKSVDAILSKYKLGSFNGMDDIYEYKKSPWSEVFGGAEYVGTNRQFSNDLLNRVTDTLYEILPNNLTSIPKQAGSEMVKMWNTQIPDLNIEIQRAITVLARSWDCIQNDFDPDEYKYSEPWLVREAREYMQSKNENAEEYEFSPPGM